MKDKASYLKERKEYVIAEIAVGEGCKYCGQK